MLSKCSPFLAPSSLRVVVQAALNPFVQVGVVLDELPFYDHETCHGSSGEVHFAAAGLSECVGVGVGADTGHEVVANDAEAHFVVHHYAQAAHHSFFLERDGTLLKETGDVVGKVEGVGHGGIVYPTLFFVNFS